MQYIAINNLQICEFQGNEWTGNVIAKDGRIHLYSSNPRQPHADWLRGRGQQDGDLQVDRGLRLCQEAQRLPVLWLHGAPHHRWVYFKIIYRDQYHCPSDPSFVFPYYPILYLSLSLCMTTSREKFNNTWRTLCLLVIMNKEGSEYEYFTSHNRSLKYFVLFH